MIFKVKAKDKEPKPKVGDRIVFEHPSIGPVDTVLEPCNCSRTGGWPDGHACGPHCKVNGEIKVFWHASSGWGYDLTLYRDGAVKVKINNLKEENTKPEATNCCNCGGVLHNPMPGFDCMKHCPKCEP